MRYEVKNGTKKEPEPTVWLKLYIDTDGDPTLAVCDETGAVLDKILCIRSSGPDRGALHRFTGLRDQPGSCRYGFAVNIKGQIEIVQ